MLVGDKINLKAAIQKRVHKKSKYTKIKIESRTKTTEKKIGFEFEMVENFKYLAIMINNKSDKKRTEFRNDELRSLKQEEYI